MAGRNIKTIAIIYGMILNEKTLTEMYLDRIKKAAPDARFVIIKDQESWAEMKQEIGPQVEVVFGFEPQLGRAMDSYKVPGMGADLRRFSYRQRHGPLRHHVSMVLAPQQDQSHDSLHGGDHGELHESDLCAVDHQQELVCQSLSTVLLGEQRHQESVRRANQHKRADLQGWLSMVGRRRRLWEREEERDILISWHSRFSSVFS